MSLQELLRDICAEYGSRIAIASDGPPIPYAVLRRRIDSISRSLLELGCGPGAHIVYLRCAGHAYVELLFAAAQIGAVFCPVSPRTEPERLLARLKRFAPDLVVADRDVVAGLREELSPLLPLRRVVVYPASRRFLSYQSLTRKQLVLGRYPVEDAAPVTALLDEGSERIRTVSYGELGAYLAHCRGALRHPPGTALLCVPYPCLTYVQEICLGLACGDTLLPMESFEPKDFIKTVSGRPVDSVYLTPSIINAVSMDSRFLIGNFSRLRRVRIGQAYFDRDTAARMQGLLEPDCVVEKDTGFPESVTRLTLHAAELCPEEWDAAAVPINSIGRPVEGVEVCPALPGACTAGEPGLLQFRRSEDAPWQTLGRGWVDREGLVRLSWEMECPPLPENAPFAGLRTGVSNRSEFEQAARALALTTYLEVFDAFAHISASSAAEAFERACCQAVLDHFGCAAAALSIPRRSVQASIVRASVIWEAEHTCVSHGHPDAFWVRDGTKIRLASPGEACFPAGCYLVCHPIYSRGCQLMGELYLAFPEDRLPTPEGGAKLCVALRHLAVLLESHRDLAETAVRLELYRRAMELAGDGIGISGLEVKPTLLFVNPKSARFINLGKSDAAFGVLLEKIQTANLQDLRQGGKNSSSRSFFYTDPEHGKTWVNYRTEKVVVDGEPYAIAFCNMRESGGEARHLEGLLSERELEIVRLITEGLTNKEIAGRVGISVNTVKYHVARLYAKMQVTNRTELLSSTYLRKQ